MPTHYHRNKFPLFPEAFHFESRYIYVQFQLNVHPLICVTMVDATECLEQLEMLQKQMRVAVNMDT